MASEYSNREGNLQSPDIIADNPQTPKGKKSRQLIRWRVPGLGFVDMYINPQQMDITEKKVIQKRAAAKKIESIAMGLTKTRKTSARKRG